MRADIRAERAEREQRREPPQRARDVALARRLQRVHDHVGDDENGHRRLHIDEQRQHRRGERGDRAAVLQLHEGRDQHDRGS